MTLSMFQMKIYHQSAVLAIQQLVDNWIISQSVSSSSSLAEGFTPPVVRMAEFPHAAYESDGFWAQVSRFPLPKRYS